MTILAPEGRFDTDTERGELVFLLEDGKIYTTDKKGSSVLAFDEYKVRLPLDSLFKSLDLGDVRPREMSWSKLSSITREEALKVDANYANKLEVERHKRWAYPVACIALTLFVLPLASAFEGLHRQTGLMLALAMFFVYYSLMSLGFSTGESGAIPPSIGLRVPNILFLCLGIYGLWLTAHERTPHVATFFPQPADTEDVMSLLFRYLTKNNAMILLPTLAVGIGLYVLTDLFERLDNFIEAGLSVGMVLTYFVVKMPLVISQILPVLPAVHGHPTVHHGSQPRADGVAGRGHLPRRGGKLHDPAFSGAASSLVSPNIWALPGNA